MAPLPGEEERQAACLGSIEGRAGEHHTFSSPGSNAPEDVARGASATAGSKRAVSRQAAQARDQGTQQSSCGKDSIRGVEQENERGEERKLKVGGWAGVFD